MKYATVSVILVCLLLQGCATVTRGTKDVVEINSSPQGALVKLSNGMQCVTPCSLEMPRKTRANVTFHRECFVEETASLENKIAGTGVAGMTGNVLLGGVIGIGIDAASGAALDIYPNPLNVNLTPDGSCPQAEIQELLTTSRRLPDAKELSDFRGECRKEGRDTSKSNLKLCVAQKQAEFGHQNDSAESHTSG